MDENQALLGKEFDNNKQERCRSYSYQDEYSDEVRGSSSEESDEWWEDSHSSCGSSCCSSGSGSSFAWESEVNVNGELFYVESDIRPRSSSSAEEELELTHVEPRAKGNKSENEKKGKLARWMRRRESKRQRPKLSIPDNPKQAQSNPPESGKVVLKEDVEGMKQVIVKIDAFSAGESLSERVLGIKTGSVPQDRKVIITGFVPNASLMKCKEISAGDLLRCINDEEISPQNLDAILRDIKLPSEVVLQVESGGELGLKDSRKKHQSNLVKRLTEKDKILEAILEDHPIGLVFIHLDKQTCDKKDIVYSFPSKSILLSSRGSFITLYHLLNEIMNTNCCLSSSVIIKKQLSHVIYKAEDKSLLLITIPDSRCTIREAINITNDLVRCLQFNYQTLSRCFTTCNTADLNHFFSVFFSRVLTGGFSPETLRSAMLENVPLLTEEPPVSQFEDILPYVSWIPLPKEAQIQIDDALNELESNDFDYEGEESLENQRLYNIVGSCFFHKGYLVASHLPKDDLLDVHSFCRQNCVSQLLRLESVKSLLVWREVFPSSVNRGLSSSRANGYAIPQGRWFLLLAGQGHDLLGVVLESGGCCVKAEGNPGPSIEYIEETEDTLRHIQKLGISNLAAQWLKDNFNCRTISPDDIFSSKTNRKKENLLSFVKTLDGAGRAHGSVTPPNMHRNPSEANIIMKSRVQQTSENSEDSISQAPSNVSEVSDENAPILGRRAERVKNTHSRPCSDSENSDSDWESFKESNRHELNSSGGSSGILRSPYFSDFNDIIPSKLTTGAENVLFHYVHLDSNEGIFMCPTTNSKSSPKMNEIIDKFRKSAMLIHTLLQNNVRFKKNSQENTKCYINKSLIAVKEHGILLECTSTEQDLNKKLSFSYWVVGRLFFAPQPREVYVCYYDEAPQNLVEIAFRLGLNAAG